MVLSSILGKGASVEGFSSQLVVLIHRYHSFVLLV